MPVPTTSQNPNAAAGSPEIILVTIGQWRIATAPALIRTLLGSCVGVVLYDRVAKFGGLAHIVLPESHGVTDQPGKYANTAIPGMISDLDRRLGSGARPRLCAKLAGGASMFQLSSIDPATSALNIGTRNCEAIERILADLRIPVLARDLGGSTGRRLTFDTNSGSVSIRVPGGGDYEI
jgi:chemotaxis protein CheD